MECTLRDVATVIHGEIKAEKDPWWENPNPAGDWNDILHSEKGGAMGIASKVFGKPQHNLFEVVTDHNPLIGRLTSAAPEVVQSSVFRFLHPAESVAPSVLSHIGQKIDDFDFHLGEDGPQKVWQEQIANEAKTLREAIENNPENRPMGVNDSNLYATTQFLKLVENGFPHFDFNAKDMSLEVGHPLTTLAKNVTGSHVTFSPALYMFHAAELPIRTVAQYPKASGKIMGVLEKSPGILKGDRIPEAAKAGIYKYDLPSDKNYWTESDHAMARTGIPQCQTVSDSLAWLLYKDGGVPLDEALKNVALRNKDWRNTSFMLNMPDQAGAMNYIRYAMTQSGWYLNLLKQTVSSNPELRNKALMSIALYSGMNYYAFGAKAAIPGAGVIAEHNKDFDEWTKSVDEAGGGNILYKTTGLDMGGALSPVAAWALPFMPLKMLGHAIAENPKDIKNSISEFQKEQYLQSGLSLLHAGLTDYAILGGKLPWVNKGGAFLTETPLPNSAIKGLGAYIKTLNDAADNPMNEADMNHFTKNYLEANFGRKWLSATKSIKSKNSFQ